MEFCDFKAILLENEEENVIKFIEIGLSNGLININNRIDNLENTMLHLSSYFDKSMIVRYLINRSADVNAKNNVGDIPLHSAIISGNISVVKLLLDNSSNVNQKTYSGLSAIMLAIYHCTLEMVKILIDYGGDVNLNSTIKIDDELLTVTPLDMAVRISKIEIIQLLINNGADVNVIIPEIKETPLHSISQGKKSFSDKEKFKSCEMAELLIQSGANINVQNIDGVTPLIYAMYIEDFLLAELFVKQGSDLNMINKPHSMQTQFHIITSKIKKPQFIDLCLKHGADYRMINGCSAYYIAFLDALKNEYFTTDSNNKISNKIIQTFWQHGCPYDLPIGCTTTEKQIKGLIHKCKHGNESKSPSIIKTQMMMFEGIQSNDVKTVKKALKSGAVARGTSFDIKYPLHFVTGKGYTDIAKVLLENGIKVNNLNDKSETALQLAIKFREINLCKLLFQHGACLNFNVEIRNLNLFDDDPSKEIKDLLVSVYFWFILVKHGNFAIFDFMKNLIKTDKEMFLVHLNALDKNKRSLMASAMYYEHGEIVEEIMKYRLYCKHR